ncbi:DUF1902 domain-containing protein [Nitrosovibrio sp. Nv4]|uniref:DUF1902 domain-containing protein n=1 Tax=Nitrosovibrio sp. Nv4 TaxID=1945880 RepID=UPI000BCEF38F|nr:protein of unknown function [Nitrosovibrio sp. Nv4]
MYRVGYPFWRVLGGVGVPLTLRVNVIRDGEVGVFIATSDDLRGLVCEADTIDELMKEVSFAVDDLIEAQIRNNSRMHKPVKDVRLSLA